ncbi:MAG: acyl-ACP desaturase [Pyrinomonadaceae bacterium]
MKFETNLDVLNWYEKQPRALTDEFISSIEWNEVKKYPLDEKLIPVLMYMRDVEALTDMYYEELRRTPTGRDPVICKFMERWSVEELTHGELLNRFLNEAGIETGEKWQAEVKKQVPFTYTINNLIISYLTNLVGKKFTATHMTFGAIHEMSTAQGYRRLIALAKHPVLTKILTAIIREESAHTQFYRNVAHLGLRQSEFAQKVARFIIGKFYTPVGITAKPQVESDYTIATLFRGDAGLEWIDKNVSQKVQRLPGLEGLTKVKDKISEIVLTNTLTV